MQALRSCLAPREALRGWSLRPSGSGLQEAHCHWGAAALPTGLHETRAPGAQTEHKHLGWQCSLPHLMRAELGAGQAPAEASSLRTNGARKTGWDLRPERGSGLDPVALHVGRNPGSQGAAQPCPEDLGCKRGALGFHTPRALAGPCTGEGWATRILASGAGREQMMGPRGRGRRDTGPPLSDTCWAPVPQVSPYPARDSGTMFGVLSWLEAQG